MSMTLKPTKKSTLERTNDAFRSGLHATVYEVRRDPRLKNKDIIRDRKKKDFQFVSGSVYQGEWSADRKEGFGTQMNPDGTKYEGEWKDSRYHGAGTMFIVKDKKRIKQFVGNWANGYMSGFGTFFYPNGEVYRGEWSRGKRSGNGKLEFPNGDYYMGAWADDLQKGFGTLFVENGNVFEGVWTDGQRNGPGRFFYAATRKVYEGEWSEDQPRCGVYRAPTNEEEIRFRDPTAPSQRFDLPELTLVQPDTVVDVSVSQIRTKNAERKGLVTTAIFPEEVIARAKEVYAEVAAETSGSGVYLFLLGDVFAELGVGLSTDDMRLLLQQLDLADTTEITFPEVVDIATFIITNYSQGGQGGEDQQGEEPQVQSEEEYYDEGAGKYDEGAGGLGNYGEEQQSVGGGGGGEYGYK